MTSGSNSGATAAPTLSMYIGGRWIEGRAHRPIIDPYRAGVVAQAPESDVSDVDAALDAAKAASKVLAAMPAYERARLLRRARAGLEQESESIAELISRESGKALKDARSELARSRDTLELSAEEAIRIEGEQVPLDGSVMGAGKLAMLLRFPVGVVAAITPFNAPVNLACHKIGPALAAGNSVVLKAPPQAPCALSRLIGVFDRAGFPPGAVNLLYGDQAGPALVRDPRVNFISFTGSSAVGAQIKAASGLRRVALELGGNGPTIVHSDADVDRAAMLCTQNSMRLCGQSCMSVQNVYVHETLHQRFLEGVLQCIRSLTLGDPLDPSTDVGCLINESAAQRVALRVQEALADGARMLTGGSRNGAQYQPTVLCDVRPSMRIVREEIFGPVLTIQPYDDINALFDVLNESTYGLHCGLFTDSTPLALSAIRSLQMGGLIINGTSTWRTDQMAYGGIKDSGIGREGPRYAIREMTEQRLVVFNH